MKSHEHSPLTSLSNTNHSVLIIESFAMVGNAKRPRINWEDLLYMYRAGDQLVSKWVFSVSVEHNAVQTIVVHSPLVGTQTKCHHELHLPCSVSQEVSFDKDHNSVRFVDKSMPLYRLVGG